MGTVFRGCGCGREGMFRAPARVTFGRVILCKHR